MRTHWFPLLLISIWYLMEKHRFPRTPLILKLHQHRAIFNALFCMHSSPEGGRSNTITTLLSIFRHWELAELANPLLPAAQGTKNTTSEQSQPNGCCWVWPLCCPAPGLRWKQMSRDTSGLRPLLPRETQVLAEPGAQLSLRCLSSGLLCQQEALLTRTWLWPVTGRLQANMLPWKLGNAKLWLDSCVLRKGCSSPLVSLIQGQCGCCCGWDAILSLLYTGHLGCAFKIKANRIAVKWEQLTMTHLSTWRISNYKSKYSVNCVMRIDELFFTHWGITYVGIKLVLTFPRDQAVASWLCCWLGQNIWM